MKSISNLITIMVSIFLTNIFAVSNDFRASNKGEIRVQNLKMELEPNSKIYTEALLPGEIVDTEVDHVIIAGPFSQSESLSKKYDTIFLFIKGEGSLKVNDQIYNIKSESIAFSTALSSISIRVTEGDTLHYIKIRKILKMQDLENIKAFPEDNRSNIYITSYDDCEAYTEKIKSPNTVSRTVLPKDYVPRVAMGTVETIGPDAVGAHKHPMLDQLFLGLAGNDVIVYADDKAVPFSQYSILHIPIGSSHWVTVDEGKKMYYQWMDFFLTKEGEAWLKTHKAIDGKQEE